MIGEYDSTFAPGFAKNLTTRDLVCVGESRGIVILLDRDSIDVTLIFLCVTFDGVVSGESDC